MEPILHKLIDANHIKNQIPVHLHDLDSLFILLELLNDNEIQLPADSVKTILSQITASNIDLICKILTIVKSEFNLLNISFDNTIFELKLLNVELQRNRLPMDYLAKYLKKDLDKESYNYLIITIIPKYIEYDEEFVLKTLWELKHDLHLVCCLSTQYFRSNKFDILSLETFYKSLQNQFESKPKEVNYLLKCVLDVLKTKDCNWNYSNIFNSNDNKDLKCFNDLVILLEISAEKQLHLIQPSLALLTSLNVLHQNWLELVYSVYLKHPQNAVVYQTIILLLKSKWDIQSIYTQLLTAMNKAEYSNLTKQACIELNSYSNNLSKANYELLLRNSLEVNWNPIAFWSFYSNVLKLNTDVQILTEIIKNSKVLPHKYIRKGCAGLVQEIIIRRLKTERIDLKILLNLLIELLSDDALVIYAFKIINSGNLIIDEAILNEMCLWLHDEHPNMNKIHLLVEIINRTDVPVIWIKCNIYEPFKQRLFSYPVLDRLTYIYCIKLNELESYILHRLDVDEYTNKICQTDKTNVNLIKKCTTILTSNYSNNQQFLAFEVLFYISENRYKIIYQYWIDLILQRKIKINSNLALGLVNLLSKIPSNYIKHDVVNFDQILEIYSTFFQTQPNEVIVRIFRSMDFILERLKNKDFIQLCIVVLNELKGSDCFETLVRCLIRSVALNVKKIKADILILILEELRGLKSEVVVYYSAMYFKYLSVLDRNGICEYLLFGDVLGKDERADYEICKSIFLTSYELNPSFRTSEIHKWALEDILSDVKETRINRITMELIDQYRINFNKRYFPDSLIHLQKLRIMQTIAFITPYIFGTVRDELIRLIVESFSIESHQASIRQLMQYILLQMLKNDRNSLNYLSSIIDGTSKTHTSTLTGFIPVLYGLDLLNGDVDFSIGLIEIMLPWTMGAHFKLRLFSQLVIDKICNRNWQIEKFSSRYDALRKVVSSVIKSTKQIDQSIFNDLNLIEYIYTEKPYANNKKLIYFISVYIPETTLVISTEWEYFKIKNSWSKYIKENHNFLNQQTKEIDSFQLVQKKIVPWQEFLADSKILGGLILITSLIESCANLGGLSRTCEIFGVKQMVVNNHKIVSDKEFQSLSMSSELWLDIIEVKIDQLIEFIIRMKASGYKAIGAEQTNDSQFLNKYCFDKKTLVLLGNERSGIPPELIPLLDTCIEIPQFGVVRSLNVHVAGAMFVWEYTKQHMLMSCK